MVALPRRTRVEGDLSNEVVDLRDPRRGDEVGVEPAGEDVRRDRPAGCGQRGFERGEVFGVGVLAELLVARPQVERNRIGRRSAVEVGEWPEPEGRLGSAFEQPGELDLGDLNPVVRVLSAEKCRWHR